LLAFKQRKKERKKEERKKVDRFTSNDDQNDHRRISSDTFHHRNALFVIIFNFAGVPHVAAANWQSTCLFELLDTVLSNELVISLVLV